MKIKNRLDKSFGPVGTTAGTILFVAGIVLIYFSFSGIILILLGAFVGFTSTSTIIDSEKNRIKFSNDIFGIIPVGKWIQVEPSMKISIKEINQTYTAYSQGNRPLVIDKKDIRLILYDSDNKEIMPVKKTSSIDSARSEREIVEDLLGLVKT